ncbi:hypothetical protein DSL72_004482 [Monilinia vaccinii-corymbosi]|uniref:C3H1-type domain-containing protein n=1 Tax=Monilinia vaccinii-corymbosi TaxID=61207 RepID=A0A8A3P2B2_9HELO|nr:hypothetical protein DSL72_004482 [Monilinia vaccinii-corymbosi]
MVGAKERESVDGVVDEEESDVRELDSIIPEYIPPTLKPALTLALKTTPLQKQTAADRKLGAKRYAQGLALERELRGRERSNEFEQSHKLMLIYYQSAAIMRESALKKCDALMAQLREAMRILREAGRRVWDAGVVDAFVRMYRDEDGGWGGGGYVEELAVLRRRMPVPVADASSSSKDICPWSLYSSNRSRKSEDVDVDINIDTTPPCCNKKRICRRYLRGSCASESRCARAHIARLWCPADIERGFRSPLGQVRACERERCGDLHVDDEGVTEELWETGKLLNMAARLHRDGLWMRGEEGEGEGEGNGKDGKENLDPLRDANYKMGLQLNPDAEKGNDDSVVMVEDQMEVDTDRRSETSGSAFEESMKLHLNKENDSSSSPEISEDESHVEKERGMMVRNEQKEKEGKAKSHRAQDTSQKTAAAAAAAAAAAHESKISKKKKEERKSNPTPGQGHRQRQRQRQRERRQRQRHRIPLTELDNLTRTFMTPGPREMEEMNRIQIDGRRRGRRY